MFHVKHSLEITGFELKIVAIVAMTCNHVANVFEAQLPLSLHFVLFAVGGITFPIMAFLLVEGYVHTSNLKKYALRLLLFALISQVPYSLVFGAYGNVLFTLLIGLGILWLNDSFGVGIGLLATVGCTLVFYAYLDWAITGFVMIYMFSMLRNSGKQLLAQENTAQEQKQEYTHEIQPVSACGQAHSQKHADMQEQIEGGQAESNQAEASRMNNGQVESVQKSEQTYERAKNVRIRRQTHERTESVRESGQTYEQAESAERRINLIAIIGTMIIPMCVTILEGLHFGNPSAIGYALIGYTAATIMLCFYRGKRGRPMKWLFYAYYPLHLFVIWSITVILL